MAAKVFYEATLSGEKLSIYRNVHAGVCGPAEFLDMEKGNRFELAGVDTMLATLGYTRTGEWTMRIDWDGGLEMSAPVVRSDGTAD